MICSANKSRTAPIAVFCLAQWMVLAADGPAPTVTPRTLSLADAQRTAFARNWDLLAAKSDVDAAIAQRIVAKEFPNPTLSVSTSKISVDQSNATTAGNAPWNRSYDNIIAVSQLFEIGGKRATRRDSARAGVFAAEARLRDARRTLDQAVAKAYVAAVQARANAEVLNQSATSLRKEARIAEIRFKAGEISAADRAQIEIAAERFEQDALAAVAAEKAARIAVDVLIAEPGATGDWLPGDSLEALAVSPFPRNVESPGTSIRPDIAAAQAAVSKAQADLRLQHAMRVPDPTVSLQYEREQPDKPNTVGIAISLPLPLWNRNSGNIAAAKAALDSARNAEAKIRAQAAADITAARVAFEEASTRLERYRSQIRPKSEQVRKTVAFAYEKGGASLLDLLSAERNDNDIRIASATAAADTAVAAANLKAALSADPSKPSP